MQKIKKDIQIGSQTINLSFGQLAPQANAAVLATSGKTVVLATVTMGRLDESKDYFPLSVEFVDKLYAGGNIKGGKWVKREGMPSDNNVLYGRIIDRSLRPLFPAGFQNEVQIIVSVLSNDKENDIIIPAFLAASTALSISDIPFKAPVSAIRVALENQQPVINPALAQLEASPLDLLVCTGPSGVNMIEAGANIVDNDTVLNAIELAKTTADHVNAQILDIVKENGKAKLEFKPLLPEQSLIDLVKSQLKEDLEKFFADGIDGAHMKGEEAMIEKLLELNKDKLESEEISKNMLMAAFNEAVKIDLQARTLAGQRYDKRAVDEVRPLEIEAGVLPCTHGSALFQRGLTQALTITTLSPLSEKQYLQDSTGETSKRYLHFYTAAPFSTGQTGRFGRPGRREIGHGALAEKALLAVIPSETDFPYTISLNSEVLSQNGSSSMASTCGSTMSLLDAGVPIKDLVAGISVGMISKSDDEYVLLTDIAGIEDHNGDMDFKITGTKDGVTAIQLDIKREGITLQMIRDTFAASTKARLHILETMSKTLSAPRAQLSVYAPKIKLISLPEDKIGEVIGSGGKTIKALMEKHQVQIDIDDNGQASISAIDFDKIEACAYEIESMIKEVQVGEEYDAVVTRVENYGVFAEFLPGREALVHISELTGGFLSDPNSIIKVGDKLKVKVIGFNDNHQIKLAAPEFKAAHPGEARPQQSQNNRTSYSPRPENRSPSFKNFRSPSGDQSRRPRR